MDLKWVDNMTVKDDTADMTVAGKSVKPLQELHSIRRPVGTHQHCLCNSHFDEADTDGGLGSEAGDGGH